MRKKRTTPAKKTKILEPKEVFKKRKALLIDAISNFLGCF